MLKARLGVSQIYSSKGCCKMDLDVLSCVGGSVSESGWMWKGLGGASIALYTVGICCARPDHLLF
jgi:hypothetical protein